MFNSVILDVAVGLFFSFLAISLATSAIVEAIASCLDWRAAFLLQGVKDLVNDQTFTGLAMQLYAHAAVNPRGPGASAPQANKPAYVDPNLFADAIADITGMTYAVAAGSASPIVTALKQTIDAKVPLTRNEQLNTFLSFVIDRNAGDLAKVKQEIAAWFDSAMDRVSGVYKRHVQLWSFVIALMLVAALNVDSLHLAAALWRQPTLADRLKLTNTIPDATAAINDLDTNLPIGWRLDTPPAQTNNPSGPGPVAPTGWTLAFVWLSRVLGWLITAFATLFGAPFWFDMLQRIVRLKGAGPSPAEKKSGSAAAA